LEFFRILLKNGFISIPGCRFVRAPDHFLNAKGQKGIFYPPWSPRLGSFAVIHFLNFPKLEVWLMGCLNTAGKYDAKIPKFISWINRIIANRIRPWKTHPWQTLLGKPLDKLPFFPYDSLAEIRLLPPERGRFLSRPFWEERTYLVI
jgi:hypothetical protein